MKENSGQKSTSTMFVLLILIANMVAITTPVSAADWPMFRNDAGNTGKSSETINLPLIEQWHSNAPLVEENGAVVSEGIAYMSTNDGKLYAFNVSNGNVVTGFPVITANNYGTPAVDNLNKKVYVLAGTKLFAFNLDGTSAWTNSVGSIGTNYNQGPIVDDGNVYIKSGGVLTKYNFSGTLQWSSITSGLNTQPSIMGDYVYVNSESGQIRKYNKATGVEVTIGGFPINTASSQASLAASDGKIFHKADKLYTYNVTDGTLVWSQTAGGDSSYYDSPAVSNGVVYVYGFDGKMYAFDENTGVAMAGFPSIALNPSGGRNWGSPAVAGDKIFIGAGTTQNLTVLGAAGTANSGLVLARYKTFSADTQGFDLCSPIISDGVVFAMLDGGGLYAFFGSGTVWTGGAIKINDGKDCTESRDVTLNLDKGSNNLVNQMKISEDPLFTGASFEPFATTRAWTLSPGFGMKTVYVQYKDSNGQLSNVFNAKIDYSETCGQILTGSIAGTKINDLNGNGSIDAGEMGLANWEIKLTDSQGIIKTNTTDNNGNYFFGGLAAGTYTVAEVPEGGWTQTFPAGTHIVVLAAEEHVNGKNFLNHRSEVSVPEFPSLGLIMPIAGIFGLILVLLRRKE